MKDTPLVSIIIPTYNRAHLIGETLESVLVQTYTNWECIVVDDGSTDATNELLVKYCKKDARFQYHHRPANRPKGANACRNYGFELSKGVYINWFDDDDIMLQDFIKLKFYNFNNQIDFVICSGFYVDSNLENKKNIELEISQNIFKEYVLWNLKVFTPSVLFKREFLVGKELFLNTIKRGQETEFFSRLFFNLTFKSYKIINEPLFLYRYHEDSKTGTNIVYSSIRCENTVYIYLENFKRSKELRDEYLINFFYKKIISIWYRALRHKDYKVCNKIRNELIKQIDFFPLKVKIFSIFLFSYIFKLDSFKLRKYLKECKYSSI